MGRQRCQTGTGPGLIRCSRYHATDRTDGRMGRNRQIPDALV
jgi:hypothetical protein